MIDKANLSKNFWFVATNVGMQCKDIVLYMYILNEVDEATRWYRDWETDRKSTRLNSSHITRSRMPSSA